jgi:hypothetical protein
VNTGTLPLTAETYAATTNRGSAVIKACATTWNELRGTRPSNAIPVANSGAGPAAYAGPLPAAGSSIRLRARATSGLSNFTMMLSVSITRTQARAAAVSGS